MEWLIMIFIILGILAVVGFFILLLYILQMAQNFDKNKAEDLDSYKKTIIGKNLSKVSSSIENLNTKTKSYLESEKFEVQKSSLLHVFQQFTNIIKGSFTQFGKLKPLTQDNLVDNLPEEQRFVVTERIKQVKEEESEQLAKKKETFKTNNIHSKSEQQVPTNEKRRMVFGSDKEDISGLGGVDRSNKDKIKPVPIFEDLDTMEEHYLTKFSIAKGSEKLNIALKLADIYHKQRNFEDEKNLYMWILDKAKDEDIRRIAANKMIGL
jgi:hypothetical protein